MTGDDTNNIVNISEVKAKKPERGRGGSNNFGNNKKDFVKDERTRNVVKKLLGETLAAYKQEKVKTDEELKQRLADYFNMCLNNGQVPTVEEMTLYTGYAHQTIYDWETGRSSGLGSESAVIIKKAKEFLKSFDAKLAISGDLNYVVYFFRAKNYYGMVDKQEHTFIAGSQNDLPQSPEALEARYRQALPPDIGENPSIVHVEGCKVDDGE